MLVNAKWSSLVSSMVCCAVVCAVGVSLATVAGCQTTPRDESDRTTLRAESDAALASFRRIDPTLEELFSRAEGWAVYPNVGRAGFVAGGAFGRGTVYDRNGTAIGYSAIRQGTVGLQAGAQSFRQLVIFLTPATFESFKDGNFEFSANMSAVAASSGGGAAADWSGGVVVFIDTRGGLMAELSVGGQQISYEPN